MILDFILYSIPWWVWTITAAIFAAVVFLITVQAFGWERVKGWIIPVAVVIGAGALLQRSRQQGYQDKVKKDLKAADRLIESARKTREKADEENADPDNLRKDDGFRRD